MFLHLPAVSAVCLKRLSLSCVPQVESRKRPPQAELLLPPPKNFPNVSKKGKAPKVSVKTLFPQKLNSGKHVRTPRPTKQPRTFKPSVKPTKKPKQKKQMTSRPRSRRPTLQPSVSALTRKPTPLGQLPQPSVHWQTPRPTTSAQTPQPTAPQTSTQTPQPTTPQPTFTPGQPTPAPSNLVKATPFVASYVGVGSNPSSSDFSAAANVTAAFLKSFLISTFNLNPFTNITSISIVPTGNSGTNNPAEIGYNVSVGFSGSIIPSSADLDTLIQTAFSQPSIQALLTSLGALPSSNPFSSTSNASYSTTIKIKSLPVTTKTLEEQWKQKHSAFTGNLFSWDSATGIELSPQSNEFSSTSDGLAHPNTNVFKYLPRTSKDTSYSKAGKDAAKGQRKAQGASPNIPVGGFGSFPKAIGNRYSKFGVQGSRGKKEFAESAKQHGNKEKVFSHQGSAFETGTTVGTG